MQIVCTQHLYLSAIDIAARWCTWRRALYCLWVLSVMSRYVSVGHHLARHTRSRALWRTYHLAESAIGECARYVHQRNGWMDVYESGSCLR